MPTCRDASQDHACRPASDCRHLRYLPKPRRLFPYDFHALPPLLVFPSCYIYPWCFGCVTHGCKKKHTDKFACTQFPPKPRPSGRWLDFEHRWCVDAGECGPRTTERLVCCIYFTGQLHRAGVSCTCLFMIDDSVAGENIHRLVYPSSDALRVGQAHPWSIHRLSDSEPSALPQVSLPVQRIDTRAGLPLSLLALQAKRAVHLASSHASLHRNPCQVVISRLKVHATRRPSTGYDAIKVPQALCACLVYSLRRRTLVHGLLRGAFHLTYTAYGRKHGAGDGAKLHFAPATDAAIRRQWDARLPVIIANICVHHLPYSPSPPPSALRQAPPRPHRAYPMPPHRRPGPYQQTAAASLRLVAAMPVRGGEAYRRPAPGWPPWMWERAKSSPPAPPPHCPLQLYARSRLLQGSLISGPL